MPSTTQRTGAVGQYTNPAESIIFVPSFLASTNYNRLDYCPSIKSDLSPKPFRQLIRYPIARIIPRMLQMYLALIPLLLKVLMTESNHSIVYLSYIMKHATCVLHHRQMHIGVYSTDSVNSGGNIRELKVCGRGKECYEYIQRFSHCF